jgi:hypothetical protein
LFTPDPPRFVDLDLRGVDDRGRDVRGKRRVFKR